MAGINFSSRSIALAQNSAHFSIKGESATQYEAALGVGRSSSKSSTITPFSSAGIASVYEHDLVYAQVGGIPLSERAAAAKPFVPVIMSAEQNRVRNRASHIGLGGIPSSNISTDVQSVSTYAAPAPKYGEAISHPSPFGKQNADRSLVSAWALPDMEPHGPSNSLPGVRPAPAYVGRAPARSPTLPATELIPASVAFAKKQAFYALGGIPFSHPTGPSTNASTPIFEVQAASEAVENGSPASVPGRYPVTQMAWKGLQERSPSPIVPPSRAAAPAQAALVSPHSPSQGMARQLYESQGVKDNVCGWPTAREPGVQGLREHRWRSPGHSTVGVPAGGTYDQPCEVTSPARARERRQEALAGNIQAGGLR